MIAVDAMGGDFAPKVIVQGAFNAARRGVPITLFGDQTQIEQILKDLAEQALLNSWQDLSILIHHTSQVIEMGQEPTRTVLDKQDSSLVRSVRAVSQGDADAVFSAGNSGAAMVAGTFILGRVDGVDRPAIGSFFPGIKESFFCLDLGVNTDCKPEFLEQFAFMGHLYVKMMYNIQSPRIGLLSNGHEPYKGSLAVKQAYKRLFDTGLNFVGNVEARDAFDGHADVLVCDGFVGNIFLKTVQGTSRTIVKWIDQERKKSWLATAGLFLSKGLFKNLIKNKVQATQQVGGVLLLGVNHPLMIAHGNSDAVAVENGLVSLHDMVQKTFTQKFNAELKSLLVR
ncbi:MAG: phosphate acyltransferase PlsX [Candidatus Dependentiae bacterium]|nr:phosphate acyltransferase PlsX [Candidatus Dependentiae bacterium]